MRPLKFLLPFRKTLTWKKAIGLVWYDLAFENSYCLTPFSPNHLVIIILSFKISSKVLQTLQRSHLQVWDWQTYFSPFLKPNCWIFTFPACMESPLRVELKKNPCYKPVFPHASSPWGWRAPRPSTVSALSSLSCWFPVVSLFLSSRTTLLSLSITWAQSPRWFWLRLYSPWSWLHSYCPEVASLLIFFFFPK